MISLASRLLAAWRAIEAGRGAESLYRTMEDLGLDHRLRLGVDSSGARELLILLPGDVSFGDSEATRGVRILIRRERVASGEQRSLVLRCAESTYFRVFAAFAADVAGESSGAANIVDRVVEALHTWRSAFASVDREKSEQFWCGIFGELHELALLSQRSLGAVSAWVGPFRRPQDFIRGRLAMEVKSSRARAVEVEIHGLEQLWAAPYDTLVLAVKHVATDAGGQRVCEVLDELKRTGVDPNELEERLGLFSISDDEMRSPDAPRFTVRSSRYFAISEATPRLTPDLLTEAHLKHGISALSYRLALDVPGLALLDEQTLGAFRRGLAQ